jgi:serine beta-lactamase-like protein LACTB, mitochondrial
MTPCAVRFAPRLLTTAALVALATMPGSQVDAAEGLSPTQTARIDAAITAVIDRQHIPGLSIAIVAQGELRWQKAYGLADVENSVPARTTTVYRIASTSKPVTAVAAMQLAEQGKLDLDVPIQKYAPAFPAKAQPITTRQLLGHLGGIRHYKPGEEERTNRYESLTAALDVFKDDPLVAEPGARFTYTTFGYTLLGVVIEGASGTKFSEYMREHVFGPAGMTHTRTDDLSDIVPNRGRGYSPKVYGRFDGEWKNAALMDPSYKIPGGGLLSTAEDLARFAIALQSGGLLGPASLRQMSTIQRTRDGAETGYGLGWYVAKWKGRRGGTAVWHGGVQPGFTSELRMLPEHRFAVVILTNLEGGGRLGLGTLADDIADIVLQ